MLAPSSRWSRSNLIPKDEMVGSVMSTMVLKNKRESDSAREDDKRRRLPASKQQMRDLPSGLHSRQGGWRKAEGWRRGREER